MAHTTSKAFLVTAGPGLREATLDWLGYLQHERRLAAKTLEAYGRDLEQFFAFLTGHLGAPPACRIPRSPGTFAFMRSAGAAALRLDARPAIGARSFAARRQQGLAATTSFATIRPPKQAKSMPKALSVADAQQLIDTSEAMEEEPWIAARDKAVLTLLYGAGLRISEALGLTRAEAPVDAVETIRVIGKGGRERVVPVLPAIRRAVEAYIAACPFVLAPAEKLFRGAPAGAVSAHRHWRRSAPRRARLDRSATPHASAAFATHLLCRGGASAPPVISRHASFPTTNYPTSTRSGPRRLPQGHPRG